MFNLFKRTKIESWEVTLLFNIIKRLSPEYLRFEEQINDKLFRGVLIGVSDIFGHVGFSYNSAVHKKYYDSSGRNFKLTGIKVFDFLSKTYLNVVVYISHGLINGYSINYAKKYSLDTEKINIDEIKKEYFDSIDYKRIEKMLTNKEKLLINPNDVYEIKLDNKVYFHIMDLEDGDFLAIDEKKVIYKVQQDPYGIIPISDTLHEFLKNQPFSK